MNRLKHACIMGLSIMILNGCGMSQNNASTIKNSIYQPLSDYDGNIAQIAAAAPVLQEPSSIPMNISVQATGEQIIPSIPKTILSEFSTSFKNAAQSRSKNINRASVAIDNSIVNPAEEFSFNNTVGPTTKRNGFKLGRIFVNGKDGKGYGGGVCQVSSTLFNAVEEAGLEVTERHPHSKPVGYVPKDNDAATSYGVIDFKFVNNKPYPIRINSYIQDENIYVAIESA